MERVIAVPGDLSRPLLGLDDTAFKASKQGSRLGREGGGVVVVFCLEIRI